MTTMTAGTTTTTTINKDRDTSIEAALLKYRERPYVGGLLYGSIVGGLTEFCRSFVVGFVGVCRTNVVACRRMS
jgi:hypothetical protein